MASQQQRIKNIGFFVILFLIIVLQVKYVCNAQNSTRFDFFCGYGFYEGYNLGSEYFFKSQNHSVSLSVGYDKIKKRQQESVALALGYNFSIFKSNRNYLDEFKWHVNNKIVLWQLEDDYYVWRAISIIPAINRAFPLYKEVKLSIDVGPSFNIVVYNKRKTYQEVGWPYHVMPSFRILFLI